MKQGVLTTGLPGKFPSPVLKMEKLRFRHLTVFFPKILELLGDWEKGKEVLIAQSCPTLCNPVDCSPSGFFVHRSHQARILE